MCRTDHFSAASKGLADDPEGFRMTRRQSLAVAGGAAGAIYAFTAGPLALFSSSAAPAAAQAATCVLTPAKTEGPYFVDELLNRSDIRSDSDGTDTQEGVPLSLTINVANIDEDCAVGEGLIVDIWHANASGAYSDVSGTLGHDWLRGYQVTDSNGQVTFSTIFPGWYSGRTIHIHFKVRAFDGDSTTYEFTSQLFFDQTICNTVQNSSGYDGTQDTTNSEDGIYGGDTEVLVPLTGSVSSGYEGEITVGLSGLPASSDDPDDPGDDDGSVDAALLRPRIHTDRDGRRTVVARVRAEERIDVTLRLVRGGKVIAKGRGEMRSGTHKLDLRVPPKVKPGAATLKAAFEDRSGNVDSDSRTVQIPRGS